MTKPSQRNYVRIIAANFAAVLALHSMGSFAATEAAAAASSAAPAEATATVTEHEFVIPTLKTDAEEVTAHEVVSQVTDAVLAIVAKVQEENADVDEAALALDELLSQVVDFKFIILNVMEQNARTASREQLQGFADVFKAGLIETYAKGMTNFVGYEVALVPPADNTVGMKTVNVQQEVKGANGTSVVSYTMAIDKNNHWVLRNMVLNGINLGKQFRNQFRVAIKKNENDLDKVIAQWNA
ncbi:ABC transporter substrate-binding protein [Halioxenophilus sp. WMMB6]|uniref:MlaC/ttg2D family ABC transporter substrate-binding protein n=1 Tax=Halioxenophilus sp. WMMB6 TaxID=3073815 RepID=UPI00295F0A4C|nr:ABC transporter substrate-binding protein [Halioxenophilus sp. WMMB6]